MSAARNIATARLRSAPGIWLDQHLSSVVASVGRMLQRPWATLLVADEPTGNLDPTLAAEIMALFAELPDRGTSVLVVSHDLALLRRMRKRVLILDHGRLVDDISPQDLAE